NGMRTLKAPMQRAPRPSLLRRQQRPKPHFQFGGDSVSSVAAVYEAVNELMPRSSPPELGGEPARTKSEQAGWFPCRYWQLREPPRPRLRSGTPPNLGGEWPHSNSFTAVTKAKLWCRNQATIYCAFILHFERVDHECLL